MNSSQRKILEKVMQAVNKDVSQVCDTSSTSRYESYALIKEDLDKFWDSVKTNSKSEMCEALLHLASTAICSLCYLALNDWRED